MNEYRKELSIILILIGLGVGLVVPRADWWPGGWLASYGTMILGMSIIYEGVIYGQWWTKDDGDDEPPA